MKFEAKKTEPIEVDMTPMIDIVFQLIAFFMVIINFEQTQADERVKLPRDVLARPPEHAREDTLTLNIGYQRDENGERTNPDPIMFFMGELISVDAVDEKLEQERLFFKSIQTELSEVTVEIRADAEVPTGIVQELIRKCQDREFQRFALRATQESQ